MKNKPNITINTTKTVKKTKNVKEKPINMNENLYNKVSFFIKQNNKCFALTSVIVVFIVNFAYFMYILNFSIY